MRILALALPDLVCELAALARESAVGVAGALALDAPLVVVLAATPDDMKPNARISAVTLRARRLGVFPGQTVAEAHARASGLDVRRVSPDDVASALGRIAEMALALGPTAQVISPDTVLLDVTGAAHLAGGEEALLGELSARVRALGHRVRGAIASGPATARAVARSGPTPSAIVPPLGDRAALAGLPLAALPVLDDVLAWLGQLGLVTVGDLARQPRASLGARLGARAAEVLALLDGDDRAPLVPYAPPTVVDESVSWDDPVIGTEPLLFALRGLLTRLEARLEGRGEATRSLLIELALDASMARLADVPPSVEVRVELPMPLARATDLLRAARTRLEALTPGAPIRSLRVLAENVTRATRVQLDLSRDAHASPDALPVLLAELAADLGDDRVGVLVPDASHVPEKRARLVALDAALRPVVTPHRKKRDDQLALWPADAPDPPTRLLPAPVPLEGKLVKGGFVTVDRRAFTVGEIVRTERVEDVAWWTGSPVSRDYARVWLVGPEGGASAWVMRDRKRDRLMVHGWYD